MKGEEPRSSVSAFVICMNEEEQIGACLESLSFCDELVVIDSFSTDRTVEIARAHGATIIQRPWPGYRSQKAFGLTTVNHDWVVNIDADERVSPELRAAILKVLREDFIRRGRGEEPVVQGYYVNRVVFFLNRWWRQGGWYPEYRLRFFRRGRVTWGGVEPHEKALVDGETAILPGELQHFTYKSIDDQLSRLHHLASISAAAEYADGKRGSLRGLVLNPLLRFLKFFVLKRGYREGVAGLVVAMAEGYYTYMKYAKLWEMEFLSRLESSRRDAADRASQDTRGAVAAPEQAGGESEGKSHAG